jgi:hypothetical protein
LQGNANGLLEWAVEQRRGRALRLPAPAAGLCDLKKGPRRNLLIMLDGAIFAQSATTADRARQ